MEKALISVIIPVYNVEIFLEKALDSVIHQSLKELEIICVNDGSTDNSLAILKKYAQKDNRIKIINQKNGGSSSARNAGLEAATSQYIYFMDSDDTIHPETLKTALDIIQSSPVDAVVFGLKNIPDDEDSEELAEHDQKVYETLFKKKSGIYEIPIDISNHLCAVTCNKLYKKEIIDKYSIRFSENLIQEDTEWLWAYFIHCKSFYYIDENYYYYLRHNTSIMGNRLKSSHVLDIIKIHGNVYKLVKKHCDIKLYQTVLSDAFKTLITNLSYEISENQKKEFKKHIEEYVFKINKDLKLQRYYLTTIKYPKVKLWIKNILRQIHPAPIDKSIPKQIFYIWLGGDEPEDVKKNIESWKTHLPDFKFIKVDENSPYFDFKYEYKHCRWFRDVYDRKLWAYVSDYMRSKVLYEHGGIYFDTDIEVIKDLTPLLNQSFFAGEEEPGLVNLAVFGTIKKHPLLKKMINFYKYKIYRSELFTIPKIFTSIVKTYKNNDYKIYSREYFYPFNWNEKYSADCIKENTYTIHWWNASWANDEETERFLTTKHITLIHILKRKIRNKIKNILKKINYFNLYK